LTDFQSLTIVLVLYLSMSVFGIQLMKLVDPKRRVDLTKSKFVYNVFQIIFKSYMMTEAASLAYRNGFWTNYLWECNSYNPSNPVMANLQWINYVSKIFDLMDTVIMVVEQKSRQLNFVHVYHHTFSLTLNWIATKAHYDGDIFIIILLISMEHVLIYLYFFAAMHAKDPATGQSVLLPWKNHLMVAQLCILALTLMNFGLKMSMGCPGSRISMISFVMIFGQITLTLTLAGTRLLMFRAYNKKSRRH